MRLIAGLDLETTGLDWAKGHKIMEITLDLWDLDAGKRMAVWTRRVNPQRPVEAKAQEIHGISFEAVAHEQPFAAHAGRVQAILSKCVGVVAHNGIGFDWPFLKSEMLAAGVSLPERPLCDTMTEARWATPLGKLPNLGELCFACSIDYDPSLAHGAEYDTDRMMQCFFYARQSGFFRIDSLDKQPALAEKEAA